MDSHMTAKFPAPWTVVESRGEFSVQDATGRTLCHFYWWSHPEAVRLTEGEARCLAEQFADMPVTQPGISGEAKPSLGTGSQH
jgi:hypothetical protein